LAKVACGAFADISSVFAGKKRGFCRLLSFPPVYWQKSPAALLQTSAPFSPAKSVVFAACSRPPASASHPRACQVQVMKP
jgi:hypothetical protein